jgi:ribosomal protein L11 methyltransferase
MNKHWTQISVHTVEDAADLVTQLLVDVGCAGTIIEPETEGVVIKGFLRESPDVTALQQRLQAAAEWGAIPSGARVECHQIHEEDWAEGWKAQFQPIEVGARLLIQPTWIELPSDCCRAVVWLNPGMAFGTGQHGTTLGCLELLEKTLRGGETVLDVGTGSGILAIAAARLGATCVMALDIDALSVEVAKENVAQNQVTDRVFLLQGSFTNALRVTADVIVANISTADVLDMLPQVPQSLKPSGTFIASGIPSSRREEVEAGLQQAGFAIQEIIEREGWVTFAAHLHSVNTDIVSASMGQ